PGLRPVLRGAPVEGGTRRTLSLSGNLASWARIAGMRILLAIHQFENPSAGGTEVYTRALAAQLAERHQVAILYPSKSASIPAIERTRDGDVRHYRLHAPEPADSFEDNWRGERYRSLVAEALDEFSPDIVHVQHLSGLGVAFLEEARKRAS